MKLAIKVLGIVLLTLCGYFFAKAISAVAFPFSCSFPIESTALEVRANLPRGRYAIVVSTNFDGRAFSVIPPTRNYSSDVTVRIERAQGLLAQGTNTHYLGFRNARAGDVTIKLSVRKQAGETLVFHLGRGF